MTDVDSPSGEERPESGPDLSNLTGAVDFSDLKGGVTENLTHSQTSSITDG